MKKFDAIIGNSPFSRKVVSDETKNGKKVELWTDVVRRSFEICRPGGTVALVHPNGWRDIGDPFKIRDFYMNKRIMNIHMFGVDAGNVCFGKNVGKFDYVVSKNMPADGELTDIYDINHKSFRADIGGMDFIPSAYFEEIKDLMASGDEERVELMSDSSYHTQNNKNMSREETNQYKYPCVYYVGSDNEEKLTLWYSSEIKGHFGVPKVIFSNGEHRSKVFLDDTGKYGLTQFARGIVDPDIDILRNIQRALQNPELIDIISSVSCGKNTYDYKLIRLFRRDFWKEFV